MYKASYFCTCTCTCRSKSRSDQSGLNPTVLPPSKQGGPARRGSGHVSTRSQLQVLSPARSTRETPYPFPCTLHHWWAGAATCCAPHQGSVGCLMIRSLTARCARTGSAWWVWFFKRPCPNTGVPPISKIIISHTRCVRKVPGLMSQKKYFKSKVQTTSCSLHSNLPGV